MYNDAFFKVLTDRGVPFYQILFFREFFLGIINYFNIQFNENIEI